MTNEEALASHLAPERRKEVGAFFTPRAIVDRALEAVAPFLPDDGPAHVVDPACGAGAFLVAARERWASSRLVGAEVDPTSAALCRERVASVHVVEADSLSTDALGGALGDRSGFELWLGNPPFNGTSPLLKDASAWARVCRWLPPQFRLKRGTSLREDYVFFLLLASRHLEGRPGALAFVTSATLLDTFSYAPVREALLERLQLREVIELGAGAFTGTRVSTCITVWTTQRDRQLPRHAGLPFRPAAPTWSLVPPRADATEIDRAWRRVGGAPLSELVPVSFPGLKTRFDELLVDGDAARLEERVRAFLSATEGELPDFARRFELKGPLYAKLEALKRAAPSAGFEPSAIRPFHRYRGPLPMARPAFCYLDRRLIPRGDHRQRGEYDPHAHPVKLVFNQNELPLAATLLCEPGCVTAYRHSRFAPLEVPESLLFDPQATRIKGAQRLVPNLGPLGRDWATRLGSPLAVFQHIAQHVMSRPFQEVWAAGFGRSHSPLIAPP